MKKTRISGKRKSELVLRLLRGESLGEVSREASVPASQLSRWRDEFINNGTQGFKKNPEKAKEIQYERT